MYKNQSQNKTSNFMKYMHKISDSSKFKFYSQKAPFFIVIISYEYYPYCILGIVYEYIYIIKLNI